MNNVFNDFLMLANIQFVENRVYEEADREPEEAKGEGEAREDEVLGGCEGVCVCVCVCVRVCVCVCGQGV